MKKRLLSVLSFIAAVITAMSLNTFAFAAGNTLTVNNAADYIRDNLSNGYLNFGISGVTYEITGEALKEFYYNSDIRYYVFKSQGVSVRADKNSFFDFGLEKATVALSPNGFNVSFFYQNGSEKKLSELSLPAYYSVPWENANSRTTASFNGVTVPALSYDEGILEFETKLVGSFTIINFEFADVTESFRWYYNYVNSAGALGILDGMGGNNFEPKSNVTRAQLAAMIVKATQDIVSYRIDPTLSFSDVPEGKWYYEYVMKCAALGIVDGVGDGKYNPLAGATREEIATVIARLIKIIGKYGNEPLPEINSQTVQAELAAIYSDAGSIHNYARESVMFCYRLGIMQGDSEGFRARSKTVRSECAKIFYLINRELSDIK